MLAVAEIKEKSMGYLKVKKIYKVPRSTLEDYVINKKKRCPGTNKYEIGKNMCFGRRVEGAISGILQNHGYHGVDISD